MRVILLIGPGEQAAARLRRILKDKAGALARHGIAVPHWNPVRLYLACSDPDRHGALRFARGIRTEAAQEALRGEIAGQLDRIARQEAHTLVLACGQIGRLLLRESERDRLAALLAPVASEVRVMLHLEEQARLLARLYPERVTEGRHVSLAQEIAMARADAPWWGAAHLVKAPTRPYVGLFGLLDEPPAWLDYTALADFWRAGFGRDTVHLRGWDPAILTPQGTREVEAILGVEGLGKTVAGGLSRPPGAETTARMRALNPLLARYAAKTGLLCPRDLRARLADLVAIDGPPLEPGALAPVSERFRADNAALSAGHPALARALTPDPALPDWQEPPLSHGFRATQYLAAALPMIERNGVNIADLKAEDAEPPREADAPDLPRPARRALARLAKSPFAPHNDLGALDEEAEAPPYAPADHAPPPAGSSGTVIVACMKNEAPYILEWIAHHRAIGVDTFLIYTNGCDDPTAALLDRLQTLGIVQHRDNDDWRGRSPQQHALDRAMTEPVVQNAEWLIHIDVDEFINVRCGNGTLADFRARTPEATNVAMTWRLFGHDGVHGIADRPVTQQFTACAPRFCPKPHTAWGYKTMFRPIGAYAKMSCHRPTKLDYSRADAVRWVNGSGEDITAEARAGGWRSSQATIGYDLLQLNHYALRSADSFLVKRDRGRALHVDRAIGRNYWIRMDWSGARDITIHRNLPRLHAEVARLMADAEVARHHRAGLDWHRAKARALRAVPEFAALYAEVTGLKLNETERVAYALALDTES